MIFCPLTRTATLTATSLPDGEDVPIVVFICVLFKLGAGVLDVICVIFYYAIVKNHTNSSRSIIFLFL